MAKKTRVLLYPLLLLLLLLPVGSTFSDCPRRCMCSHLVGRNEIESLRMRLHRYRVQSVLARYGRNRHVSLRSPQKTDMAVTCIGLASFPSDLPHGTTKLSIFGENEYFNPNSRMANRFTRLQRSMMTTVNYMNMRGISQLRQLSIEGNMIEEIRPDAFKDMSSLTMISLRRNGIKRITPNFFKGLKSVETCDFSKNKLTFISLLSDTNLPKLKTLLVQDNDIEELYSYDFIHMFGLRELDLSNNSIEYFDPSTFYPLIYLKRLKLRSNNLKFIYKDWFKSNTKLEYLDLAKNSISIIDSRSFVDLKNLKYLILAGNELSIVDNGLFDGLVNLSHLDLSYNSIALLFGEVFKPLKNLRKLDISHNTIKYLDDTSFRSVASLTHLYARNNSVRRLDSSILSPLINLTVIDFSYNHIQLISSGLFRSMTELREIHLNNNQIRFVGNRAFSVSVLNNLSKLIWLVLDGNRIEEIKSGTFFGTPFLRYLGLSNNSISQINRKAFQFCRNLVSLDMENNHISMLPDKLFQSQLLLRSLSLSNNNISKLNSQAFHGLGRLIDLFLDRNAIDSIVHNLFQPLTSIRQLNVSVNRLKWVDLNDFYMAKRPLYLDLSRNKLHEVIPVNGGTIQTFKRLNLAENQLSYLEEGMIYSLAPGGKVNLGRNPWKCSCELSWVPKIYREKPKLFIDRSNVICNSPKSVANKELVTLDQRGMCYALAPPSLPGELSTVTPKHTRIQWVTSPMAITTLNSKDVQEITTSKYANPTKLEIEHSIGTMPIMSRFVCDKIKPKNKPVRGPRLLASWHASVIKGNSPEIICSGVRLDNDWVVMTASCLEGKIDSKQLAEYSIIIGTMKLSPNAKVDYRKVHRIKRIYTHIEYRRAGVENDVAMVYLKPTSAVSKKIYTESPCIMSKYDLEHSLNFFSRGKFTVTDRNVANIRIKVSAKTNRLSDHLCSNEQYICSRFNKVSPQTHNLLGAPMYVRYGIRDSDWGLAGLNTVHTRLTKSGKTLVHKHLPLYRYINWFEHVIDQEAAFIQKR